MPDTAANQELWPQSSAQKPGCGFPLLKLLGVFSPADDEGRSRESSDPPKLRARQNVVFELGFFFGSLGRGRVCAVYENGVDLPSDLHGVLYVECDQGGSWKYAVAKEIKAAGYEVDLNQV
jgi:predicted nucleotide-binding protein